MDQNPTPGTSGLQRNTMSAGEHLLRENELQANDEAISALLQQDIMEQEGDLNDGEESVPEYDVEAIRAKRVTRKGVVEYLVKWENYPESDNSWEPIDNLKCPELILRFNEEEKNKKKRKNQDDASEQGPSTQQKRIKTKPQSSQVKNTGGDTVNASTEVSSQSIPSTSSTSTAKTTCKFPKTTEPRSSKKIPQKEKQQEEPLLLEDMEADNVSTETLSSGGGSLINGKDKNGLDVSDDLHQQTRNFLLKGFDRCLPIEKIVGSAMDDQNKLWFFVKWKEMPELEAIDATELEEKAPRDLCVWYRERLFYAVNNPSNLFPEVTQAVDSMNNTNRLQQTTTTTGGA